MSRFERDTQAAWPLGLRVDATLRLVAVEPEDAQLVFGIADANRDHLMPWVPWVTDSLSVEGTRRWLARTVDERAAGSDFTFLLVEGADVRGMLSLVHLDEKNRAGELSYWLTRDAVGRGLVTRAIRAVLAHGFDALGLNRFTIRVAVQNGPSRAVAERVGFQLEGVMREVEWHPLGWVDLCLYALLHREFETSA